MHAQHKKLMLAAGESLDEQESFDVFEDVLAIVVKVNDRICEQFSTLEEMCEAIEKLKRDNAQFQWLRRLQTPLQLS